MVIKAAKGRFEPSSNIEAKTPLLYNFCLTFFTLIECGAEISDLSFKWQNMGTPTRTQFYRIIFSLNFFLHWNLSFRLGCEWLHGLKQPITMPKFQHRVKLG